MNVAGLSISLMFVLLISNMVTRQLTVDSNVPDADRISVIYQSCAPRFTTDVAPRLQEEVLQHRL